MSDPFLWVTILAAILGTYFSILKLSLATFSRSEVEERLGDSSRRDRVAWVASHDDELILVISVWRHFFTIAILLGALLTAIDLNAAAGASDSSLIGFLLSIAAVVLFWLYLSDIGIADAVAEHSASSVVKGALWFLPALSTVSKPLTIPLTVLNEIVRRLVGAEVRDDLEDDIRQVVEESEREGTIGETEREILEAIVDFRTATADEVMTPRIDIRSIEKTDDLQTIREFVIREGHSRIPVYDESIDKIVGILYVKDLLPYLGREANSFKIENVLRAVPFIPESRRISDLLVDFQQKKIQMAIVLDEYGGTMEDIIEEIVGEIRDEHEKREEDEPAITKNHNGIIEVDARFHIDDLNDEIGTDLPEDADFDTVGGWVFAGLGRIPAVGEKLEIDGLNVEILQAEETHIDKVRILLQQNGNGREKTDQETTASESAHSS